MAFQDSFLSLMVSDQKVTRTETFLWEMEKVIPWSMFVDTLTPYYEKSGKTGSDSPIGGRPRRWLLLMLKMYCLSQWYNLSDEATEEAIYDRISFQKFLDINIVSLSVPDETTLENFRYMLEENNLTKVLFEQMNTFLENKWLILKRWTSVDATIITAPSSTKNKKKERDPEMKSTKKGSNYSFGMKIHAGTDTETGVIHSVEVTAANIHDSEKFDDCLHWKEWAVFADKGYFKDERKKTLRSKGIFCGILDKAKRGSKLSSSQKKRNKQLSSVRAKTEHPFHTMKCLFGYRKVRYKWLEKNTVQVFAIAMLANIHRVRKSLLYEYS